MTEWPINVDHVLIELRQWTNTATVMQSRIQAEDEGPSTRRGDMYLFAMAARQVLRFAYLAHRIGPTESSEAILTAIRNFETMCPDLKDIRDVLDHYDDYLEGGGKTYPANEPTNWQEAALIYVANPTNMWTVALDGVFQLHVIPAPGKHLVLDIPREAAAARELAVQIEAALST